MDEWVNLSLSGSQEDYAKVQVLLRKNRQALDSLFKAELGHECKVSDLEMIGDALHSQLSLTRTAIRVLLNKKLEG